MVRTRVPSQARRSCTRPRPLGGVLHAPPRMPGRAARLSPKAVALPTPAPATSPASPASPLGRAPTFAEVGRVAASWSSKHHVMKKLANGAWPPARQPGDCKSQSAPRGGGGGEGDSVTAPGVAK